MKIDFTVSIIVECESEKDGQEIIETTLKTNRALDYAFTDSDIVEDDEEVE